MLGRARSRIRRPGGLVQPFGELGVAPRPAGEPAVEGGLVAAAAARVDGDSSMSGLRNAAKARWAPGMTCSGA